MKRMLMFLASFLFLLFLITPVTAETEISLIGLRPVEHLGNHVKYAWKCQIRSNDTPHNVVIHVSLKDGQGFEIDFAADYVRVNNGRNEFTGTGMCSREIWDQVKEYMISLR